jgi:hypothetical protein
MQRAGFGHGDVLLIPATIPVDAKLIDRRVLAHGETGHAHALVDDADVSVYEDDKGTLWLRVGPKGAGITHEEHGRHEIAPGEYRVGRQAEWDYDAAERRNVAD